MSALWKTSSREWDKPQTGEKFLKDISQNMQRTLKTIKIKYLIKNNPKTSIDTSSEEVYRWQVSVWDITTHLLKLFEETKSETVAISNAGKEVEQQEF